MDVLSLPHCIGLNLTTFLLSFTFCSPGFSPQNPLPLSAAPCPFFSCCDSQGNGACRLESVPSICGSSVWTGWVILGLGSQTLLTYPLSLALSSKVPPPSLLPHDSSHSKCLCHPCPLLVRFNHHYYSFL